MMVVGDRDEESRSSRTTAAANRCVGTRRRRPGEARRGRRRAPGARHRAYVDGDVPARREAERILYFVNIDNCFAPPLHAVASLAWTTLMRDEARRRCATVRRLRADRVPEMSRRLKAAVAQWGAYNHPLVAQLCESGPAGSRRVSDLGEELVRQLRRVLGAARRARPAHDGRSEEGRPREPRPTSSTTRSPTTRCGSGTTRASGMRFSAAEALDDPDRVLEATELLNTRTGLSFLRDPIVGARLLLRRRGELAARVPLHLEINRARGADDHILEYWTGHATADEDHSAEWLAVARRHVPNPSDCADGSRRRRSSSCACAGRCTMRSRAESPPVRREPMADTKNSSMTSTKRCSVTPRLTTASSRWCRHDHSRSAHGSASRSSSIRTCTSSSRTWRRCCSTRST